MTLIVAILDKTLLKHILKQVSVFLEPVIRVHEIMWKELSLQVNQSQCHSTETNLNLTNN